MYPSLSLTVYPKYLPRHIKVIRHPLPLLTAHYQHQTRENLRHHLLGSVELQRLVSGVRLRPER